MCFRLLLVFVFCLSSAIASDTPYYNSANQPYWWNTNRFAVNAVTVTEGSNIPASGSITLRVTYQVKDKNGNVYITADGDYSFTDGVRTSSLPTPAWTFDPRFNDPALSPYTLTILSVSRPGFGQWNGPVTLAGDKVVTMSNLGDYPDGTRPSSAITQYTTFSTIVFGPYNDCPPRDLTFKLDLAIQAAQHESHAVELKLLINEVQAAALPRTVSKGPVSMNLSLAIPNVPGAFTYKWTLNGKVVASGMWGCGDEIPFNIVSDLATETAEPLPDQDKDGDPDESDFDDDGDGIPDVNEGIEPPKTPPPGTNAGPGAPIGSEGTPIPPKGSTAPQPNGSGGGGGGGGDSSDVNVLNVKDFGEQFKWAFENAGNNNGFFPSPGNGQTPYPGVGWSDPSPGELSTSAIDDAKEALDDAQEAAELLKGDAGDEVTALASHKPVVVSVPPGTAGIWRMNIGKLGTDLFGQNYWDVDMRPFEGAISGFRSLVTWLLLVISWFKFWNFFRSLVPA